MADRVWSSKQTSIFEAVANEEEPRNLVVVARAGSGKTTTSIQALRCLDREKRAKVLTCAFNKEIQEELNRRVPNGVDARTFHSLGLSACTKAFGRQFVNADHDIEWSPRSWSMTDRNLVKRLISAAKNFWLHTEEEVTEFMCSKDEFSVSRTTEEIVEQVIGGLERSRTPNGEISFDDMVWLPAELGLPMPKYDWVSVDETQDLNGPQLWMARACAGTSGRIMAVGDDRQCHPPGVMIRTDEGEVPIERLSGKIKSWNRNGQKMIGGKSFSIASRKYKGDVINMVVDGRSVPMTPNHRLLCRWSNRNSTDCVVYLMYREDLGFRVGWCKLFCDAQGTLHISHRSRIEKSDKTWILKVFANRTDASVYESIISCRYGIPTTTFEPVNGATHLVPENIRRIFDAVPSFSGGSRCLVDHGRRFDLPFYPWPGTEARDKQGRRTYFVCYAANLLDGHMMVPLPDGQNSWAVIESTERTQYEGLVYSLDVEKDHSYSANGVVVLNCIYGFRGADMDAMGRMVKALNAKVLPLNITYRCARKIAALAQELVPDLECAPDAPEGVVEWISESKAHLMVKPGDFILSRTNAPLMRWCLSLLRENIPARIRGRDVGKNLQNILVRSGCQSVEDFIEWLSSYREVELRKLNRAGASEAAIQALYDKIDTLEALSDGLSTVEEMQRRVLTLFDDTNTSKYVMCSTVHKSKGLEADRVFLIESSFFGKGGEEDNIRYVAITRAKNELYLVS